MKKHLSAIEKLTPKTGYNLVGVDDYELPGEELYLVAHYKTAIEAAAARDARRKANPGKTYHVYGPKQ